MKNKPQRRRTKIELHVKRNWEWAWRELLSRNNTTNATTFLGAPPKTMLLSVRRMCSGCVTLRVEHRRSTWSIISPDGQSWGVYPEANLKYWLRSFIRKTR